ncbi:MAG TPA: outer membrane beta-barrel protein, partial [Puia sp.]
MIRQHPVFFPKFFCSLVLLTVIGCAHAQSGSTAEKRFGFQAGINMTAMNFNLGSPPPPTTDKVVWKPGIVMGFLLRVSLAKDLFLQPEYAFTQRNGSDELLGAGYRLDYLSMPLLLGYRIAPCISLLAGPQLELLI